MGIFLKERNKLYKVTLTEKSALTHNTKRFKFSFPDSNNTLGLQTCNFLLISVDIDGKSYIRPYNPISDFKTKGYFELAVKIYPKDKTNPTKGIVSRYLDSLKIGDSIDIMGPRGAVEYHGRGLFMIQLGKGIDDFNVQKFSKIGLIAGGTGITPIFQFINIVKSENDVKVWLIYCNKTLEDIIFHKEIEVIKNRYSHIKVW